jgi:hypothetical protein
VLIKEKNYEGALAIFQQILKDNECDGDAQYYKA